jgi:peptidoglycan hydrolase CwlO-like protein
MSIDTKVQVTQQKVMDVDNKVAELQKQLTRMEDKLDKRGSR